jgi:hypothetical protein
VHVFLFFARVPVFLPRDRKAFRFEICLSARRLVGGPCRKTGIAIDETSPDCEADQFGGARYSKPRLNPTAVIGCRLVADPDRIGDLRQGAASRQLAQDLDIP